MTDKNDKHLTEDELLKAVVEEADLPASLQGHLKTCQLCHGEKALLEQRLTKLGHMAQRFAPAPSTRVEFLPARESTPKSGAWSWNWRNSLVATMAAAAMVLVIVYGSLSMKAAREARLAALTQELWEDDLLMTEIKELSENALPLFCSDISGESYSGFDEEFEDFVVPSTEADIVSRKGGGVSC